MSMLKTKKYGNTLTAYDFAYETTVLVFLLGNWPISSVGEGGQLASSSIDNRICTDA